MSHGLDRIRSVPLRRLLTDSCVHLIDDPTSWTEDMALVFLDSVLRGYPVGQVLVWRTSWWVPLSRDLKNVDPRTGPVVREYVIDGTERLNGLLSACVPGRAYIDLSDDMVVRSGVAPESALQMSDVLDGYDLRRALDGIERAAGRETMNRALYWAERFRTRTIDVVSVVSDDVDTVREILRRSHLP